MLSSSQSGLQEEAGVGEHHLKMGRQLERPRPKLRPEAPLALDCGVLRKPGWGL